MTRAPSASSTSSRPRGGASTADRGSARERKRATRPTQAGPAPARSAVGERATATGGLRPPGWTRRLPQTRAAIAYAQQLHQGQRRKADGAPFITHPVEVASLLFQAGAADHLIAAGALHDVIEKTEADATELTLRFGSPIAALVVAVTEDEQIAGYSYRKLALRKQVAAAGHEALSLFAADKISKVRELSLEEARTRENSRTRRRRLTHYHHCLHLLEQHLPESPLVSQLRTELTRASYSASQRSK